MTYFWCIFQVITKFMVTSRQAANLDKERIKMEMKIKDMEKESIHRMRERMKLEVQVKELKNLAEELRADIVKKDIHLDHL